MSPKSYVFYSQLQAVNSSIITFHLSDMIPTPAPTLKVTSSRQKHVINSDDDSHF